MTGNGLCLGKGEMVVVVICMKLLTLSGIVAKLRATTAVVLPRTSITAADNTVTTLTSSRRSPLRAPMLLAAQSIPPLNIIVFVVTAAADAEFTEGQSSEVQ